MALEGLDGFVYELRVDVRDGTLLRHTDPLTTTPLCFQGPVDHVEVIKRNKSGVLTSNATEEDLYYEHEDDDDDDIDGSDEAAAFGIGTLDLSRLSGKLPVLPALEHNDDVERNGGAAADDNDDKAAKLQRKKAFQSLPNKGGNAPPPVKKSASNVGSLGSSKSGNKASLFDVFADLDGANSTGDIGSDGKLPLPSKASSLLSSSQGSALKKLKKPHKSASEVSIVDKATSRDEDSASGTGKKKKKKSRRADSSLVAPQLDLDRVARNSVPNMSVAAASGRESARHSRHSVSNSAAASSAATATATTTSGAAPRSPRSPRHHHESSMRSTSPRRRDFGASPRSPRSLSPRSYRSPRAASPRGLSPRRSSSRRSPRGRSPRRHGSTTSSASAAAAAAAAAGEDDSDANDNDALLSGDQSEPRAGAAAAAALDSSSLPLVGGAPIGAGTLIDVTKLRAGKTLKAPDTKGDVGQAARTHLVTTRADGTKSLSAIPGSISPLDKDRADEQLYGSLLKGQPKHRAKSKKGFFHRAGRSTKRQGRFSRLLIAAHPEASFVPAEHGGNDAVAVSAAPLVVLVELLSHPREHDDTFEDHFLLTFRSFATAVELLEALVKRFESHTPVETPNNALVRERILQFIMRWMQVRDDFTFDESLGVLLVDFLSATLEKPVKASETKLLTEVFNLFKAKIAASAEGSAPSTNGKSISPRQQQQEQQQQQQHQQQQQTAGGADADVASTSSTSDAKQSSGGGGGGGGGSASSSTSSVPQSPSKAAKKSSKKAESLLPPPIPFLPINMSYRSTGLSFFDLHPVEIARQMTLLEHNAFLATSLDEWCGAEWQGTIGQVIIRFNDMSRWVSTELVSADTVEYRALLVRRFIVIASTCLSLNNFNGVMEVLSGLQAPSVQRLKATWKQLSGEANKAYRALADLMSLDAKNVGKYRERMEQAAAPCVPYIGFYVRELSNLEESAPTYFEDGRINVAKQASKIPVLSTIRMLQTEGRDERYNLVPIGFIQDFLLQQASNVAHGLASARLLNDEELMAASLKREPAEAGAAAAAAAAAASDDVVVVLHKSGEAAPASPAAASSKKSKRAK
jgi:hypothetical protein